MEKLFPLFIYIFILSLFTSYSGAETEVLEKAIDSRINAQTEAIKSQSKVDSLVEQTRDIVQQYRDTIRKSDSLQTYNDQLAKLVKSQNESLASIQRQLDNAEETQRSIVPLMLNMIDTLDKFIALDMPFLKTERNERIALLKSMMDRSDVTLPDKYRRIMESYLIELEYGRTIESYSETVAMNGQEYTVDVLRVGRLSMTFQTPDGELSGVWNKVSRKWEELSDNYNRSIKLGLQVAKKQAPPELIKLPVQVAKP